MGATREGTDLWRGGIVPYEINADLGNILAIEEAIKTFEAETNLRFVGRTLQEDYVRFSKQTQGQANSEEGRQGGKQFLNASLNDVGTLLHEIGHAIGLMHEQKRADRDDFLIFHPDRLGSAERPEDFEKEDTNQRSETYDFESLMHYNAGNPSNPWFESRTGVPAPADIGSKGVLTLIDRFFLEALYPSPPIIRRSDGEGGAGRVLQTSALAKADVNNTAILATAIRNKGENYHLIRWRVRDNGVITRIDDLPDAIGGKASGVHLIAVGRLFVAAMKDDDGELLLISHKNSFERLSDTQGQAGEIEGLQAIELTGSRILTACISKSGRLLLIVWSLRTDGTITRQFDSGEDGPKASTVAAVALPASGVDQLVAVLTTTEADNLSLSIWNVGTAAVERRSDSGAQMQSADLAQLVATPSGHVVVTCRDGAGELLLIPFSVPPDGSAVTRISAEGKAGKVNEIACVARPYGLLTAVISEAEHVLLIAWSVDPNGKIKRLGESGTQAGEASQLSVAALPFNDKATVCTVLRNARGNLLPITWDDAGGPGELSVS